MIYELNHCGILVQDLDRSLDFYCGFLGGVEVFRGVRPEGPTDIVYIELGGGLIELIHGPAPDPAWGVYGLHHLGFMTDDLEADYARLSALGEAWRPPAPAGTGVGSTAFVRGPSGERIELLQRDLDMRTELRGNSTVTALDHFSIIAKDGAAARRFYSDALGATLLSSSDRSVSSKEVSIYSFGGDVLEVYVPELDADVERIAHIALCVPSVPRALEALAELGGFPDEGYPRAAFSGVGEIAVIRDPDGACIELLDRPPLV